MIVFPKEYPMFYIQPKNILKEHGLLRLGFLGGMFCVEDQFFLAKHKTEKEALEHFNDNVRIDNEIKKFKEI